MSKLKGSAFACEHANEVPAQCPCPPYCYCKKHTCKPLKKGNRHSVKVRVYMKQYEDEENKQGVEIELTMERPPKNDYERYQLRRQIQEVAEKELAIRVKYPGKKWEKFET